MRRLRRADGFTLIELLVVILIIGILAAIAIPAFVGQRTRAQDQQAKSHVAVALKAARTFALQSGSYGGISKAELIKLEPTLANAPSGWWEAYPINLEDGRHRGTWITIDPVSGSSGGGWFAVWHDDRWGAYRFCERIRTGGCGPPSSNPSLGQW